jgi:hypothetical protein
MTTTVGQMDLVTYKSCQRKNVGNRSNVSNSSKINGIGWNVGSNQEVTGSNAIHLPRRQSLGLSVIDCRPHIDEVRPSTLERGYRLGIVANDLTSLGRPSLRARVPTCVGPKMGLLYEI